MYTRKIYYVDLVIITLVLFLAAMIFEIPNIQETPTGYTVASLCQDSDGFNYNRKGHVFYNDNIYSDYCSYTFLVEQICKNNKASYVNHACDGRCFDGRCVK